MPPTPSCSPEKGSQPRHLPQSKGWELGRRKVVESSRKEPGHFGGEHDKSPAAAFLPRCDAAIAPSRESSSCSPHTSNH